MASRTKLLLAIALVLGLSALRLIHLRADTPLNFATGSFGAYVDEGYKTLAASNLLLYGTRTADPHWQRAELRSPVCNWTFLLAFRTLGLELRSARLVTILWFMLLLLGFVWSTIDDYDPVLLFAGLSLLGLIHTLFFFSRLAVFVVPATTCLYWLLFILRKWGDARPFLSAGLSLLVAVATTFAIKITAPVYFAPVLAALALGWILKERRRPALFLGAGLPLLAAMGALAYYTRSIWLFHLDLRSSAVLSSVLLHPFTHSNAFWVILALACGLHILLTRPRDFAQSPYRASLLLLVLVGPVLLALFSYSPLRYYVPLVPAYVLLPLEWFHLRAWRWPLSRRPAWINALLCLPVLIWAVFTLGQAVNLYVLYNVPIPLGAEPGLGDPAMFLFAAPLAVLLSFLLWPFRKALVTPRNSLVAVCLLALLALGRDLQMIGGFMLAPSYEAQEITRKIDQSVPPGAVIAGDWAPFLTLGTKAKPYRLFDTYPRPERLARDQALLRSAHPDYFLWNERSANDPYLGQPRWLIQVTPGISLESPLFKARYAGKEVILYPLSYDSPAGR